MSAAPDAEAIRAAARALAAGEVVCLPTESTYGLAVDLRSPAALRRLTAIKRRRPSDSPFPLIAPDAPAARALARAWPPAAQELAALHWPGPLTIVVAGRGDLPPEVCGPHGVGVRVSSHPIAAALARALGAPITATSANPSGAPPAQTAEDARALLEPAGVSRYLDGGRCDGVPSTVVAVDDDGRLTVLRRGAIAIAP